MQYNIMMMAAKIQILLLWVRVHDPSLELWLKNLKQYLTFTLMLYKMSVTVQSINTEYLIRWKMTYLSDEWLKPDIITFLSNYTGCGLTSGCVFNNFCISLHATNSFTLQHIRNHKKIYSTLNKPMKFCSAF